jgi:hypothetical protein
MYVNKELIKLHYDQNKGRALNFAGADEAELEAALKESMKKFEAEDKGYTQGGNQQQAQKEPEPEEPKFKAFTGKGISMGGPAK